jgi:hypothetical protein
LIRRIPTPRTRNALNFSLFARCSQNYNILAHGDHRSIAIPKAVTAKEAISRTNQTIKLSGGDKRSKMVTEITAGNNQITIETPGGDEFLIQAGQSKIAPSNPRICHHTTERMPRDNTIRNKTNRMDTSGLGFGSQTRECAYLGSLHEAAPVPPSLRPLFLGSASEEFVSRIETGGVVEGRGRSNSWRRDMAAQSAVAVGRWHGRAACI